MAKKSARAQQKAEITAAQQKVAELRAQQSRKERRQKVALTSVVLVVLAGVIGALVFAAGDKTSRKDIVQGPVVKTTADTGGIDGVHSWQYTRGGASAAPGDLQQDHVGTSSVGYTVSPPVGGPHDPTWLNCGRYDKTPRIENAVHDLEHGAVWITYRPDLAADQVTALKTLFAGLANVTLTSQGRQQPTQTKYVDLFPYPSQRSPIVLTSWGHQLDVSSAADPRIAKFIDTFRASRTYSPEYGGQCNNGIGKPDAT
jgi:multidrug efflux pump subunit AcrA (membrane-fusion protein)